MKNNLLIFLIFISIIGCSAPSKRVQDWKSISFFEQQERYNKKIDWNLVQPGDILVQETDGTFLGWFGHCGIVVSSLAVAEIPKLGERVYYRDINDWKLMRRVIVLRYKNLDYKLANILREEIRSSIDKPYLIVPKESDIGYYCSQYIWNLYYKSGKKLGRVIDIDGNGGFAVMPYDFIDSKEIEIVDIMK